MTYLSVARSGRVELKLEKAEGQAATYALRVDEAGMIREGVLRVEESGVVSIDWLGEAAAEWLVGVARAVARMAWRQRCEGMGWPRRLSRWRMRTNDD